MSRKYKRLVLFDIDGTLILGGALWKEAFLSALKHHCPDFTFPKIAFSGKTDLQICRELMEKEGYTKERIDTAIHNVVNSYVENARKSASVRSKEVQVLPGVVELLEKLKGTPDILVGLLTGNVKEGAAIKLQCVNLHHYFPFGIFCDDHYDRYEMPALAVKKVEELYFQKFESKDIVIIGDTIHDINCGKSLNVRTIAVGTNPGIASEDLFAQNPDYYFKDLSATHEVVHAILEDIL